MRINTLEKMIRDEVQGEEIDIESIIENIKKKQEVISSTASSANPF